MASTDHPLFPAPRLLRTALALSVLAAAATAAAAPAPVDEGGIYTCIDANGRRLTADRPILACIDREQQRYGRSGTVRERLGPSMTAEERAAEEGRQRKAAEDRVRQAEVRRRDRLLLQRYPDRATHEKERQEALAPLDAAIAAGRERADEQLQQHRALQAEAKAAGNDAIKAPRAHRALEQNEQNQAAQHRLLAAQVEDRARIAGRFDEELERLQRLWVQAGVPASSTAPVRSAR